MNFTDFTCLIFFRVITKILWNSISTAGMSVRIFGRSALNIMHSSDVVLSNVFPEIKRELSAEDRHSGL